MVGLVEECTQESREDLETSQKILARSEVQGEAVEDGHSDSYEALIKINKSSYPTPISFDSSNQDHGQLMVGKNLLHSGTCSTKKNDIIWEFFPTWGGGLPKSQNFCKFTKYFFVCQIGPKMAPNGQKHVILIIWDHFGPS